MEITAAVARARRAAFTFESLQLGEPRSSEVVVDISGVALCHTNVGRVKPSGIGRELGPEGMAHFLALKSIDHNAAHQPPIAG